MLRSMYAHDYFVDENDKLPLLIHTHVYVIADKYNIPLLKDLAKEKFAAALGMMDVLDVPSFVAAVEVIHTTTLTTESGLRGCLLLILKAFWQKLRDSDDFMNLICSGGICR